MVNKTPRKSFTMGEKEDREKAEKLAAAKKRVAQLQKKKKAAAVSAGEKAGAKDKAGKDDALKSPVKDAGFDVVDETSTTEPLPADPKDAEPQNESMNEAAPTDADPDEALFNEAINVAHTLNVDDAAREDDTGLPSPVATDLGNPKTRQSTRQPSLSLQSKLRSSSFRQMPSTNANGPLSPTASNLPILSPEGDTMPDIYRKQAGRLEELERENKRLMREVEEGDSRWRRTEEELEELREKEVDVETQKRSGSNADGGEAEIAKLRAEIAAMKRARSQSMSLGKAVRSGSVPDGSGDSETLRREVESKDATISDMGLEISKLRAQMSETMAGCETHGEQIGALQENLGRAEGKVRSLEGELADARRKIERASERAVRDGTERMSWETRVKQLESEVARWKEERDEVVKKSVGLERKVETIGKVHREAEERNAKRVAVLEGENGRFREEKARRVGRGGDGVEGDGGGEGLDELEDEERRRLEKKVRELEGEVFDLRRGFYKERRAMSASSKDRLVDQHDRPSFEVDGFDEVDLSGSGAASRRRSLANSLLPQQPKHSGFSQVLNSGLAAFRGAAASPVQTPNRPRNDSLLQDFDDDADDGFDEAAFAQAQREEEARKMVEHVREVKRKLKDWKGWRLDLVDSRRMMGENINQGGVGGGWFGEVFDV